MKVAVSSRSKTQLAEPEQDSHTELPGLYNSTDKAPVRPESFNKAIAHLNKQRQIKHSYQGVRNARY